LRTGCGRPRNTNTNSMKREIFSRQILELKRLYSIELRAQEALPEDKQDLTKVEAMDKEIQELKTKYIF